MKDKRQRQATQWPMDPNLFTFMVQQFAAQQAVAQRSWPFPHHFSQPGKKRKSFLKFQYYLRRN
jgi:hypothetical protein